MSEPTNENTPTAPVEPKTLTPYRHKLGQSAFAIAQAVAGRRNMTQEKQVKVLRAVVAELRKMTAGAVKALELAEGRDYEAYLQAKKDVAEGKLSAAEQAEFDKLVQGLTAGDEYSFTPDEVDPDDEAAMAKLAEAEQGDSEV
jgi:hypothetical protein